VSRGAVRALVATTVAIATLIAALAFKPGSEAWGFGGTMIREAGGMRVAATAFAAIVPGLFVWLAPRPRVLWWWTAIAMVASLVLYALLDDVHPSSLRVMWWPARVVEIAMWTLAASTVLGSYIGGFAMLASEANYHGEAPELAARLRKLAVGLAVLAVVLLGVSLLPGQRVYSGADPCLGHGLAALGNTEHQHISCSSSYTRLRETYRAGGGPRLALYLLVVLVPAWPLYRDPRPHRAWTWFGAAIAGSVVAGNLMFYLELEPDFLSHTVTLWPTRVVEAGVAVIQVLLLLALPLMIARSRHPRVPVARVVKRA
jgi:hypothetical protein